MKRNLKENRKQAIREFRLKREEEYQNAKSGRISRTRAARNSNLTPMFGNVISDTYSSPQVIYVSNASTGLPQTVELNYSTPNWMIPISEDGDLLDGEE